MERPHLTVLPPVYHGIEFPNHDFADPIFTAGYPNTPYFWEVDKAAVAVAMSNGFPGGAAEGTQMLLFSLGNVEAQAQATTTKITAVRAGVYRLTVYWGTSDPDTSTTTGAYTMRLLAGNEVMTEKTIINPRASIMPGTWSPSTMVVQVAHNSSQVLKALRIQLTVTGTGRGFADKIQLAYGTRNRFRLTGGHIGGDILSLTPGWTVMPLQYTTSPQEFTWSATPSAEASLAVAWYRPLADAYFEVPADIYEARFPIARLVNIGAFNNPTYYYYPGIVADQIFPAGMVLFTLIGAGGSGENDLDNGTGGGGGQCITHAFFFQEPTLVQYYVGVPAPVGAMRQDARGATWIRIKGSQYVAYPGQVGRPGDAGRGGGWDQGPQVVGRGGDGGLAGGGGGCGGRSGHGGGGDADSVSGVADGGDGGGRLAVRGEPPVDDANYVGPFPGGGFGSFSRDFGSGEGQAARTGRNGNIAGTAGINGGGGSKGNSGGEGQILFEFGPMI
jgi:hypothetical protein